MASRLTLGASACTVALVAATFTGAAAVAEPGAQAPAAPVQAQPATAAPSQAEVKAAKVDPAAKSAMVQRLQKSLDDTSKQLEQVAENAQTSWDKLSEAQQLVLTRQERAKAAATQASAAQQQLKDAQERVGQIAASAYRNGGYDATTAELLSGDPQAALDRARTLRTLSDSSTRDLRSSEASAALATQWKAYADATQRSAEQAVSAQTEAEQQAQQQASGFREAVEKNTTERSTLLSRLAELNGTSVKDEEKAQPEREEKARAAALAAAKEAAAAKAAQEAEARRAEEQRQAAEAAAAEEDGSVVDGIARPAELATETTTEDQGTQDSSDGGQEEGSSSDAGSSAEDTSDAEQQAADEADAKAKAEQEAKDKADAEAAAQAAADKKAAEEAAAQAEQAKKDKEAAEEAAAKASAAEKAEAAKQAAQEAKAKAEAAQKKAAAEKKAAQEAAAKAAAKKKAAAEAAAKKKAEAAAAAKKKAEQEAAAKADEDDTPSTGSSSKEAAIAWALQIAGNDKYGYIFGANGPTYFDCSSFALTAFNKSGVSMTRTSTSQYKNAPKHIPLSQLKRGDLVFSSSNGGASMYHVAIYIGDGQVVHARNPSAGISTTPLSWVNNLYPMAARY